MTIVLSGGGSGGHITPILAVASELKKLRPKVRLVYIGQHGDKLADIPAQHGAIDEVYTVQAGKFRRYQGEGWRQVFDLRTQGKNVRDAFLVLIGIWQSFWLVQKLRPQIIFTRGGFVSVPVALGGKLNGVPYITHDSDSTPSLANRIIARWAAVHAVALPEHLYPYPQEKTVTVGVPVSGDFVPVTSALKRQYRRELGLTDYTEVLLITGGGNGAEQLNNVVVANALYLLKRFPRLAIVHIAGRGLEVGVIDAYDRLLKQPAEHKRVRVKGFITDMYRYSGAADVIVARSGATGLAEFAIQGKACVIVPTKQLVWQTKHAAVLEKQGAIRVLDDEQTEQEERLGRVVGELLDNDKERERLAVTLKRFARADAARSLAMLLLEKARELSSKVKNTTL